MWGSSSAVLLVTLWAYWPTLREMVHQWERQPDYSHGYLVIPIAAFFLYSRRDRLPWDDLRPSLWGLALLALASLARVLAGLYYLVPLDGWTLPVTIAGLVCLLFGRKFLWWSLPAVVFLWFMVPIPYSAERWLSVPLQSIATKLSTASLVFLGQPAIAEGNVLRLGEHTLFVEEACSGMRIFFGIFAAGVCLSALFPLELVAKNVCVVGRPPRGDHRQRDADRGHRIAVPMGFERGGPQVQPRYGGLCHDSVRRGTLLVVADLS